MLNEIKEFFENLTRSIKEKSNKRLTTTNTKILKEKKKNKSKNVAKERLHIVLVQDRANVSTDFLELMKQEIIDVIKKYVIVDEKEIDVRFTSSVNADGTTSPPSLYANVPILNIRNEMKSQKIDEAKKAKERKLEEKVDEALQKDDQFDTMRKAHEDREKTKKTELKNDEKIEKDKKVNEKKPVNTKDKAAKNTEKNKNKEKTENKNNNKKKTDKTNKTNKKTKQNKQNKVKNK